MGRRHLKTRQFLGLQQYLGKAPATIAARGLDKIPGKVQTKNANFLVFWKVLNFFFYHAFPIFVHGSCKPFTCSQKTAVSENSIKGVITEGITVGQKRSRHPGIYFFEFYIGISRCTKIHRAPQRSACPWIQLWYLQNGSFHFGVSSTGSPDKRGESEKIIPETTTGQLLPNFLTKYQAKFRPRTLIFLCFETFWTFLPCFSNFFMVLVNLLLVRRRLLLLKILLKES